MAFLSTIASVRRNVGVVMELIDCLLRYLGCQKIKSVEAALVAAATEAIVVHLHRRTIDRRNDDDSS